MKRQLLLIVFVGAALLSRSESLLAQQDAEPKTPAPKSVTVFPIVFTPSDNVPGSLPERVAEVIATFLERSGVAKLEIAQAAFSPPASDNIQEIAAEFGKFVARNKVNTDFALLGQIVGTPGTGPQEIRAVVVDQLGKAVFLDQVDKDGFSNARVRPENPMTCAVFLVDRLNRVWDLGDPNRPDAPRGEMAERLAKRSGQPPKDELDRMAQRLAVLQSGTRQRTFTVYPIHLWPGSDADAARDLAKLITQRKICRVESSSVDPGLTIKGDPNQQKVLWDTARAFRDFLRRNSPGTEYALLADYAIDEERVGHVHLVVCDKHGDFVLVDYQNSHHDDFQEINPRNLEDCNRLAVVRFVRRLSNQRCNRRYPTNLAVHSAR